MVVQPGREQHEHTDWVDKGHGLAVGVVADADKLGVERCKVVEIADTEATCIVAVAT